MNSQVSTEKSNAGDMKATVQILQECEDKTKPKYSWFPENHPPNGMAKEDTAVSSRM